jgi:hypothetical protein
MTFTWARFSDDNLVAHHFFKVVILSLIRSLFAVWVGNEVAMARVDEKASSSFYLVLQNIEGQDKLANSAHQFVEARRSLGRESEYAKPPRIRRLCDAGAL